MLVAAVVVLRVQALLRLMDKMVEVMVQEANKALVLQQLIQAVVVAVEEIGESIQVGMVDLVL
jgi:hypothetical protein